MTRGRLQLLALGLVSTLVIAVLLRDVVEQLVVRPTVFIFWMLGVIYRFIPQPVLWLFLILVMLYFNLSNFMNRIRLPRQKNKLVQSLGPVEELAAQIERKDSGIYFKWQIARTLGDLALDLQELRSHTRRRELDFDGAGTQAGSEVRRYLLSSLTTSFSDYPLPGGIPLPASLRSLPPTPFDGDIGPVIDYLETQMESTDDLRRS